MITKIKDKANIIINTTVSEADGILTITVHGNEGINTFCGWIKYSDCFSNYQFKKEFFAKTLTQLELKINKCLYNFLPEDEIFWFGWSSKRGIEKRTKMPTSQDTIEEYYRYCKDNKNNIIINTFQHDIDID